MDEWFEEFMPGTYLEDDLERTIIAKSNQIFPDYYTIIFNLTLEYEGEKSKPDLCLVEKDYTNWYIVEVELATKPFKGHTEKQVRVFSNARYNANQISEYLFKKNSDIDKVKMKSLIRKEQPHVLVMVSDYPTWANDILNYSRTGLLVFGMFEHPDNIEAYRIDGEYPFISVGRSVCQFPKYPANILKVLNPSLLAGINHEQTAVIYYEGKRTKWTRIDDGKETNLVPTGLNPLNVRKKYFLILNDKNELYLKEK